VNRSLTRGVLFALVAYSLLGQSVAGVTAPSEADSAAAPATSAGRESPGAIGTAHPEAFGQGAPSKGAKAGTANLNAPAAEVLTGRRAMLSRTGVPVSSRLRAAATARPGAGLRRPSAGAVPRANALASAKQASGVGRTDQGAALAYPVRTAGGILAPARPSATLSRVTNVRLGGFKTPPNTSAIGGPFVPGRGTLGGPANSRVVKGGIDGAMLRRRS